MALYANFSINLDKIPKDKVIKGAKGNYVNITLRVNDKIDPHGNNTKSHLQQSKEEREGGKDPVWLGDGRVVWTNGRPPVNAYTAATESPGDKSLIETDIFE